MTARTAARLGSAFARAFIATVSRQLPKRAFNSLGLAGLLDRLHAAGWRIRVVGARYDLIWGQDVAFQQRHKTVFLPDPDLLAEDEFLALATDRLARAGFAIPKGDAISSAIFRAKLRLRDRISTPV